VDIGSINIKVVLLDNNGAIVAQTTARSGYSGREVAMQLIVRLLTETNLDDRDIVSTVATGYGRFNFPAACQVTEITCQALGISHLYNEARTVIDIGGQDSKIIKLTPGGKVADFIMNDKCSAGTGRFLEVMSGALEIKLEDMGRFVDEAKGHCTISSFCTVFAESEVVSHVAAGVPKADIIAGICESVASRVASMVLRIGLEAEVVFTGGVARNKGVVTALIKHLDCGLLVPELPEISAALGAALFARSMSSTP